MANSAAKNEQDLFKHIIINAGIKSRGDVLTIIVEPIKREIK